MQNKVPSQQELSTQLLKNKTKLWKIEKKNSKNPYIMLIESNSKTHTRPTCRRI
jgi:ribosomal protein L39E